MTKHPVTLIGGGLVGALLALQLARRGFSVDVFEKRPDPRRADHQLAGGRSINLALAERGLQALRSVDLADEVMRHAVMMRGRMVHDLDGDSALQRYGVDDSEVNWSVSRGSLNMRLLDAAESAGARFHFEHALISADFDRQSIRLGDNHGQTREFHTPLLIGADGAGSAVRAAMHRHTPLGERIEPLGHAYKELEIPAADALPARLLHRSGSHGSFALEPHALHIWPRGGYMCIALPNVNGSFTVTIFLASRGPAPSFEALTDATTATAFFQRQFPDLLALVPDFAHDYSNNPVGNLSTLYLDRWHIEGRAVLLGDAAHAIVPFHGQGMNCGFEDTVVLAQLLADSTGDRAEVFAEFQRERQPQANAIATMALENYIEMRDSVADPHYLAKRELGAMLAARSPQHYMARYRLVTFTHVPYAYALERGRAQDELLEKLLAETPRVSDIDLDAAVERLETTLPPLRRG